jgi:hypothetical protein
MNRLRYWRLVSVILVVAAGTAPASGVDLSRINRIIAKEPTYRSAPRYCLLVFGPEARTHVWLVIDGNTLYVDRNSNGDLTEAGEAVFREDPQRTGSYEWLDTGTITEVAGKQAHQSSGVALRP